MHPMTFGRSFAYLFGLAVISVAATGTMTGVYGVSSGRQIGEATGAALAMVVVGTLIAAFSKFAFFRRDEDWTFPFLVGAGSIVAFALMAYMGMTD